MSFNDFKKADLFYLFLTYYFAGRILDWLFEVGFFGSSGTEYLR